MTDFEQRGPESLYMQSGAGSMYKGTELIPCKFHFSQPKIT